MNTALYLLARAKLNLVLRIVGRRADGYHLLETLFQTLDLHDDVAVERTPAGLSITVTAEQERLLVSGGADNLALRAIAALQAEVGDRSGFHVRLHKRIPNGAGLGGGSSDAAAALRLGNVLLGEPLDQAALARIAVTLGADVPFFLRGGSQWGRGIGDQLLPVAAPARHFVLLVPPFCCETAAVYKIHAARWRAQGVEANLPSITVPENTDAVMGIGYCNQLEPAAEQLRPELGRLRRTVAAAGYPRVRMTGSGSTLFVGCDDEDTALACRHALRAALPAELGVELLITRTGPVLDVDRPSGELPATVRGEPRGASAPDRGD